MKSAAEEIMDAHDLVQHQCAQSRISQAAALENAWNCGRLLAEQKARLKHGEWGLWLECNCKSIQQRTAQNYMTLHAKFASVAELREENQDLTSAYRSIGVLPALPPHEPTATGTPAPYVAWIQRTLQFFNTHDVTKADEQERQRIKLRLKPLADLYARL